MIKMCSVSMGVVLVLATGCGELLESFAEYETSSVEIDDAILLSALEDSEDGGDGDYADATDSEGPPMHRQCTLSAIRQSVIERYDADGDGSLDESELEQLREDFGGEINRRRNHRRHTMRAHRLHRLKWIYDGDNSRSLDDDEKAELLADLETRCENRQEWLLSQFDADDDGSLCDEEWGAARDAHRERVQEHRSSAIEDFDTNGDGRLSHDERHAAREAQRDQCEERREERLATFDADGDGELSDEEEAALRDYLKEFIRGEHFGEAP